MRRREADVIASEAKQSRATHSGLTGGVVALAAPVPLAVCFQAGGRTRIATITSASLILLTGLLFSPALAAIPAAVLFGILVAICVALFDRRSLRLLSDIIRNRPGLDRRHAWQSLSVVATVMLVTMLSSIVVGALAGFVLSCLIFIVGMSRPIVRRRYRGHDVFSKRVRSADDMAILMRTGPRRAVLELQGVLFFGNADDLSRVANEVLEDSDMILFDFRGISDMGVSGETILGTLVAKSRQHGKIVLFCNVPPSRLTGSPFAKGANAILPDLDSALEWMEEETLRTSAPGRPRGEPIPIASLDLAKDLTADELETLLPLLILRDFPTGKVICGEGEDADRMWILTKGSVSVRLRSDGQSDNRRIAGMAAGATVGEMALLEEGKRSATVVADEEVLSYELSRPALETILQTYPQTAVKLLNYFAREMVRRLRINHQELRTLTG
jgi:sulfate permease, SulP family